MDTPSRRTTLTIALCFIVALIEGFDLQAAGTAAAGLRQTFAPVSYTHLTLPTSDLV